MQQETNIRYSDADNEKFKHLVEHFYHGDNTPPSSFPEFKYLEKMPKENFRIELRDSLSLSYTIKFIGFCDIDSNESRQDIDESKNHISKSIQYMKNYTESEDNTQFVYSMLIICFFIFYSGALLTYFDKNPFPGLSLCAVSFSSAFFTIYKISKRPQDKLNSLAKIMANKRNKIVFEIFTSLFVNNKNGHTIPLDFSSHIALPLQTADFLNLDEIPVPPENNSAIKNTKHAFLKEEKYVLSKGSDMGYSHEQETLRFYGIKEYSKPVSFNSLKSENHVIPSNDENKLELTIEGNNQEEENQNTGRTSTIYL